MSRDNGTDRIDPAIYGSWLRDEIEEHLEYQMGLHQLRDEIGREGTIARFKGPYLEFTKKPRISKSAEEFASDLKADDLTMNSSLIEILADKFPRGLFAHQLSGMRALLSGKNVVLPHPTGSGKTEIFTFPILNHLLKEIASDRLGLGCILIYPMKALENDQRDRLKGILFSLESKIGPRIPRMGIFDGDTPTQSNFVARSGENRKRLELERYREECPQCHDRTLAYNMSHSSHLLRCRTYEDSRGVQRGCGYPTEEHEEGIRWIVTTREGMKDGNFPNLLITNPESLDFRLLTPEDKNVFATRMSKVIVVVDEAHAYSGESALSLRVLLSRLEEKIRHINMNPNIEFQYVLSSATIDEPARFASNIVPWVKFEEVAFEQEPSPLSTDGRASWSLSHYSGDIDFDRVSDLLLELASSSDPIGDLTSVGLTIDQASTALNFFREFGLLDEDEESARVAEPLLDAVAKKMTDQRFDLTGEIKSFLKEHVSRLEQARQLYQYSLESVRTLDEIVDWWEKKWNGETEAIRPAILFLIRLGRFAGLWEERWHYFVRTPIGIALCSCDRPHHYAHSTDEPLPTSCSEGRPFFETFACQDCGRLYFLAYRCPSCGVIHPNRDDTCCRADPSSYIEVLICRESMKGRDSIPSGIPDFNPEEECTECSGKITPIRRRTDLVIEVSTSLMAWRMKNEGKRKFLLFNDSRSSSERISREFNNLEIDLWSERLVMDIMTRDPTHDMFDERRMGEVRKKLFSRVYNPYYPLRTILRSTEWEHFESALAQSAFRAMEKSNRGPSRLFEHGLLCYDLGSIEERMAQLNLGHVLPRILDLIRLKASRERGVSKERLFNAFIGKSRHSDERFQKHIAKLVGWNEKTKLKNEMLNLSLDLLVDRGWIRRTTVNKVERYYLKEKGDPTSDPFGEAPDIRALCVPRRVWMCDKCGTILWYPSDICEYCGNDMQTVDHHEVLEKDYFARVMMRPPRPVVAAVHRAGFGPIERRVIEERFSADKDAFHFLSSTPTLELGIDIGNLSFVMLAGVPPTRSSYIQRVGRAGRRKGDGAVCVTFCYPRSTDAYYFRNPHSLVSMKASRIPVQAMSSFNMSPYIWSSAFDAFSTSCGVGCKNVLSGKSTAKSFLSGETGVSPSDMVRELSNQWKSTIHPYVKSILTRAVIAGKDNVSMSALDSILARIEQSLSLDQTPDMMFHIDAFRSHLHEVDAIGARITSRISALSAIRRTKDEERELKRLNIEYKNLLIYQSEEMISSPLLNYAHDIGILAKARGIEPSIDALDILSEKTSAIDSRQEGEAIFEFFPGAYLSRQGSVYLCNQMVYDPVKKSDIFMCEVCRKLLASEFDKCSAHPHSPVVKKTLLLPVVAFARFAHLPVKEGLETRALREHGLLPVEDSGTGTEVKIGELKTNWSMSIKTRVADFVTEYATYRNGFVQSKHEPIQICTNCYQVTREGRGCCDSPSIEKICQGRLYETRGIRVSIDWDSADRRLACDDIGSVLTRSQSDLNLRSILAQTTCNALLNSISLNLCVEPSMLDAVVDPTTSDIWIYEPTIGGSGLLEEALSDERFLTSIANQVVNLVQTREDHNCICYCDQCLLVPRYSNNELESLNRQVLEMVLKGG